MTSTKKVLFATMTVALLLFGALAFVPNAAAQATPNFSISVKTAETRLLVPVQDTGQIVIEYKYSFQQPGQQIFGTQGSVVVTIDMDCGSNVIVTGDSNRIIAIQPQSTAVDVTETLTKFVTINRQATALESIQCNIDAEASAIGTGQGVPKPPAVTTATSIKPDYFGAIEAKSVGNKLQQGGPQKQIPFQVEVKNFGNGQTRVKFEVVERPGNKDWQGLPPDAMLLDQKDGGNANGLATFTVSTPYKNGWNNEEGAFLLRLTPEYNFNSEKKGGDVDIQILARVRGVYVPSLEPMVMVGAVIGSAMMARLLRKEE